MKKKIIKKKIIKKKKTTCKDTVGAWGVLRFY